MMKKISMSGALCQTFLTTILIILAIMVLVTLILLIRGKSVAKKLMYTNVMGGQIVVLIAIMSLVLEESYLLDISLIYALLSFLAVLVLSNIYIGAMKDKQLAEKKAKRKMAEALKKEAEAVKHEVEAANAIKTDITGKEAE